MDMPTCGHDLREFRVRAGMEPERDRMRRAHPYPGEVGFRGVVPIDVQGVAGRVA